MSQQPKEEDALTNAAALRRGARREAGILALLFLPAFLVIALFLLLPVGWLFVLSVVQKSELSLVHYARMVQYSSYLNILVTTLRLSVVVTVVCVLLGYPVAYLITQLPRGLSILCLSLVVIPFWTSLLVRTYAWLVLLNSQGPVNSLLLGLKLVAQPVDLLFNETGAVIGMVQIMLPFFVLPLYGVTRSFDWNLMQAAASLGAPPPSAFVRVFLPLSLPGLAAGAVLVFVQTLGFYVTPAILGGGKVTMVAMKIASNVREYFEWGAASALGMVLLLSALGVLSVAARLLGFERALGLEKR
jgi:putative spermidine/putrescine transport system permease protein/spermidine/putrescine transport system permease protein